VRKVAGLLKRFIPGLTVVTIAVLGLGFVIPVPYVMLTPGPVFNTIGSVDGKELIRISGAPTYQTAGQLDMLTVSEFGGPQEGLDVIQAVKGLFDGTEKVLPRQAVFPEGVSSHEIQQRDAEDFSASQSYAIGAALSYLKLPVHEYVYISSVTEGAPAQGKLHAGDKVIAINGKAVSTPDDVVSHVHNSPIGTPIVFKVDRTGHMLNVTVWSAAHRDDPATSLDESKIPYVGISLDTGYAGDFPIEFGVDGVGGPSAGTMFAVGIIDKLTPGFLNGGKNVAGTGTIDGQGKVGPIGGIQQKMVGAKNAGATLFLAPATNCDEVIGHIPAGLTVTPIKTLSQAVQAIKDYSAGKHVSACSTN